MISEGQGCGSSSVPEEGPGVPNKFRYKEIEDAADGFWALLGQGALARVYEGILNDGTVVQRSGWIGKEHGRSTYLAEISAIVSIWHTYLTRLYCYCCVPDGPRFLLYEFMPKGSLDWWIFTESGMMNRPRGCPSWSLRYRAAVDVAKADGKDESRVLTTTRGTREWLLEQGISEISDIYIFGMAIYKMPFTWDVTGIKRSEEILGT
ncbi:hypothetical protein MLD38_031297 [Melastoma candidum]|uniref:Uncharacterized protein n=1 Tax=Melastoma candidum TaxID=119954 RepID=A0ACB9MSS5_9MYRT|nr:hypothetical protein MLD38_031297 [Melastoma candidum]